MWRLTSAGRRWPIFPSQDYPMAQYNPSQKSIEKSSLHLGTLCFSKGEGPPTPCSRETLGTQGRKCRSPSRKPPTPEAVSLWYVVRKQCQTNLKKNRRRSVPLGMGRERESQGWGKPVLERWHHFPPLQALPANDCVQAACEHGGCQART